MEVLNTPWGATILFEANKFWFYALVFSLLSSFLQLYLLYFTPATPTSTTENEKVTRSGKALKSATKLDGEGAKAAIKDAETAKRQVLIKKIAIDACDLVVPGSGVGWIPASPGTVGMAMVISTLLASEDIWARVQRES
jgi:hypothetical protein